MLRKHFLINKKIFHILSFFRDRYIIIDPQISNYAQILIQNSKREVYLRAKCQNNRQMSSVTIAEYRNAQGGIKFTFAFVIRWLCIRNFFGKCKKEN